MKVGVLTVSFGEERFIGACIDQFKGYPVDHMVLCSKYPWNGDAKPDNTARVAKSMGANVIEGDWRDENTQRNEGVDALSTYPWILIVDSDEYYTDRSIRKIMQTLRDDIDQDHRVYESWRMESYWKTWNWAIRPMLNSPVIAVRPRVYPRNIRSYDEEKYKMPYGVTTYHLSYVRSNKEIKRKIKSWGHSHEVPGNWYKDKWLEWDFNTTDFGSTQPDSFKKIVEYPIPDEIKDRLERTGWKEKEY